MATGSPSVPINYSFSGSWPPGPQHPSRNCRFVSLLVLIGVFAGSVFFIILCLVQRLLNSSVFLAFFCKGPIKAGICNGSSRSSVRSNIGAKVPEEAVFVTIMSNNLYYNAQRQQCGRYHNENYYSMWFAYLCSAFII